MSFKENLHYVMESKGLAIKELASRTGISQSTIKAYLKRDSSEPTASKAVKIARELGVSVEYLVEGTDAEHRMKIRPEVITLESKLNLLSSRDISALSHIVSAMTDSDEKRHS